MKSKPRPLRGPFIMKRICRKGQREFWSVFCRGSGTMAAQSIFKARIEQIRDALEMQEQAVSEQISKSVKERV